MCYVISKDLGVQPKKIEKGLKRERLPRIFQRFFLKNNTPCLVSKIKLRKNQISLFFLEEKYTKAFKEYFSMKIPRGLKFLRINRIASNLKGKRETFPRKSFLNHSYKNLIFFLWNNQEIVRRLTFPRFGMGCPEKKTFCFYTILPFSIFYTFSFCYFYFETIFLNKSLKKIKIISSILTEERRLFLRMFVQVFK